MDSNLAAKCFICNVECCAQNKYLCMNVARTLTMEIKSVLVKCLREIVDVDHEYFCAECMKKIEDYDRLVQLSSQIETELYGLYRKKMEESSYPLDVKIIEDQNAINEERLAQTVELKMEKSSDDLASPDAADDICDNSMVVQSDKDKLKEEQKEPTINETHEFNSSTEFEKDQKSDKSVAERDSTHCTTAKMKEDNQLLDDLIEGELKHIDEIQRFICDICGRSYKSKSAVRVHLGIHSGQSSEKCHICGKKFSRRGHLVRHLPMHTGEQPYQCDVCGKRFTHYSSFHMHQMIHTNERRKKCNICGSEFRSTSDMTRHMRTHTGEKPFSCPICGQKFAQRYNMKSHYNRHNDIHESQSQNHKCVICSEAFQRRAELNKHLQQAHRRL
ncbi:zinc finger protein 239-like isoform X4 [Contarinia nasturtii]|uniref:zinc finger protein 239-like isoform X4 n=1 Tax=Contarinia nasturtii TaxID=265458 RepID=UPI0012D4A0D5|nr:zinc finger protein 239-like isoform X4 [Contarinia nasturtii]